MTTERAGKENVASIVAMGKATELAAAYLEMEASATKRLRDKLERELVKCCPDVRVNGDTST
jgi:cysteine desulfurase